MSSGTRYNPGAVRKLIGGLASRLTSGGAKVEDIGQAIQRISRLGMSPRQMMLNRLWAWYRTEQYAARQIDWNGGQVADPIEHEAIAHGGVIPPGFYDAGSNLPLKFRKPTAPYALTKVIVDRFTGLLFSERHHPQIRVGGDEMTEDFVNAIIEAGRLWPQMIMARTYGGAMGTVVMGFQFVDGNIEFEVHDPRWCVAKFTDRSKLKVGALEKRYMYPMDEIDPVTGQYETVWYWHRRLIDQENDILFEPALVDDGTEPEWIVSKAVAHGLGFCPIVWMQNLPVQDDIDGDPDCHGIYDLVESIDALLAQSNRGTISNCDPTLVLSTDAEMSDIKKGSDNAIKLPIGGSSNYMEMQGVGLRMALDLAKEFRGLAMEIAQVVLEHPDVAARTATEIERVYSSMITKADVMREQYGEKGIKPLLEMVLVAAAKQATGSVDEETGLTVKGELNLPPQIVVDPTTGEEHLVPRQLGKGGVMQVQWPRYFEPMLTDVELATRSAIAAKTGGLIDQRHAVEFVAEHYKVEDVPAMLRTIELERSTEQDALSSQALGMLQSPGVPGGEGGE